MKIDGSNRIPGTPDFPPLRGPEETEETSKARSFDDVSAANQSRADLEGALDQVATARADSPKLQALRARLQTLAGAGEDPRNMAVRVVVDSALDQSALGGGMPARQRERLAERVTDFLANDPEMNQRIQRVVARLLG